MKNARDSNSNEIAKKMLNSKTQMYGNANTCRLQGKLILYNILSRKSFSIIQTITENLCLVKE